MNERDRARTKFMSLLPGGLEEVSEHSFSIMARVDPDVGRLVLDELVREGTAYESPCGIWYGRTESARDATQRNRRQL